MQTIFAKLLKDGVTSPKRRTLFPNGFENEPKDKLLRTAGKNIPPNCTTLYLYVNGPAKLLAIVVQICFDYEIDLALEFPEDEDSKFEEYMPLRYWECGNCGSRYPHDIRTCPYCGGLGYTLGDKYGYLLTKKQYVNYLKTQLENFEIEDEESQPDDNAN